MSDERKWMQVTVVDDVEAVAWIAADITCLDESPRAAVTVRMSEEQAMTLAKRILSTLDGESEDEEDTHERY